MYLDSNSIVEVGSKDKLSFAVMEIQLGVQKISLNTPLIQQSSHFQLPSKFIFKAGARKPTISYIKELSGITMIELGEETPLESKSLDDRDQKKSLSDVSMDESWVQRKSRDIEVGVKIAENNEAVIKIVHNKKRNCLMFVSKLLDQLQLDLSHVNGGKDGDCFSFLFTCKICEGSLVDGDAIAKKLVEVVDGSEGQNEKFMPTKARL